jgi:hypothetical protein
MLWPLIKYPMYSFQSTSDWILFIPLISKLDYMYSSQLNSIGMKSHANENGVIDKHKTRYML